MKLALCRVLIGKFDKAQEDRLLTPLEIWFHKNLNLKVAYLRYASLEQTITLSTHPPYQAQRASTLPFFTDSAGKKQDPQLDV
jgi:hypothetical protein